MRVLLVSLNRETFPIPVMPAGVLHIAANLRRARHEVRLIDFCFGTDTESALRQVIAGFAPEFIGLSLRNLENHQMNFHQSYLPEARRNVQTVLEATAAPVVVGGASFSLFAREVIEYLGAPLGLAGEAESTIVELVSRLGDKREVADLPGLCYWKDGQLIANRAEHIHDFADLPLPAFDLFDPAPYLAARASWGVETKRGCEFLCSFCAESAKHEHYRFRPVNRVVDEIEGALSYGIDRFSFVDGIFNFPRDHAAAVCEEIIRRGLAIRWSAGLTPLGLTADFVDLMKQSGCAEASLGLDTASARMLQVYHKAFDNAEALRAFELLNQAGVNVSTNVLIGGPGETVETVAETVRFIETMPQPRYLMINLGIRIYPGTALEPLAIADGWSPGDGGIAAPRYYASSALPADMPERLDQLCQDHDNWYTPQKLWRRFHPEAAS